MQSLFVRIYWSEDIRIFRENRAFCPSTWFLATLPDNEKNASCMSPRSSNLSTRFAFFICFFAESSKKDRTEAGILNQQARLSTSNWFHAPQDPSSIPFSSHQQHQRTSEPLISSNHVYHLHSRNYEGPSRSFPFPRPTPRPPFLSR